VSVPLPHVSVLASLADPSQRRLDLWHRLETAARRLAKTEDPTELSEHLVEVSEMLDTLAGYERYWLFPGVKTVHTLREYLDGGDLTWLAQLVTRAAHRLSEYGESASLFDIDVPLAEQDREGSPAGQHFVTVLLADDTPEDVPHALAGELRRIGGQGESIAFGLLVVGSVEDAVAAAAMNSEIQACIIRHSLPMRSPLSSALPGDLVSVPQHCADYDEHGVTCGRAIRELRPHLDLYLLTDESVATRDSRTQDIFSRAFYRLNDVSELRSTLLAGVRRRYETPFFDALRRYAADPIGQFHALPVARGASIFNSRWLRDMGEFYGRNIFLAETSSTSGGLDSLLDPHGTIQRAMEKAAKTWGALETFFVTNGTSTANKIIVQALTRPGDIVLIDRNCHQSHHYGLVLAGALPLYLEAYPLPDYAIYGAVPLETIKRQLLALKAEGRLDEVRMLLLTNCTFDGVTYNPIRVMEEVLAIKPDMCFLWDEAWYAFATAVPFARQRTAMSAAARLAERLASPDYRAEYTRWREDMDGVDESQWADHRLLPDPDRARVRVYATHSTHKSLSALRQASIIHVWDQDFDRLAREQFNEAYLTHTSTSPNQQLTASLDLARRQVDLEGYAMVRQAYRMALAFRERVATDPLLKRWFRVLDVKDLIPGRYRASENMTYLAESPDDVGREWDAAWRDDEFVLDPTRVTLYLGRTGMNGFEFREQILMNRFGVQINKTSINSVLLIFTIGVTWSSLQYLLDALRRTAAALARTVAGAGRADRLMMRDRTRALTSALPPLPNFSAFDPAFRPTPGSREGDVRAAVYTAYEENNRTYVSLAEARRLTEAGQPLVSATFVVPYPPGFPVLVPGQVLSPAILNFLINMDVKEIHGYRAELGLSVLSQHALDAYARLHGRDRRAVDGADGVGGDRRSHDAPKPAQ